jgi:hypothetical protein
MVGKLIAEYLKASISKPPKPGVHLNVGDVVQLRNWDDSTCTAIVAYLDIQADLIIEQNPVTGELMRGYYGAFTHEVISVLPRN